jgi:hypothetical protein
MSYGAIPPPYTNISYSGTDTITLDPDNMSMTTSITLPSAWSTTMSSNYYTTSGINGSSYNNVNITNTGIDMTNGTDLKIDGKSLKNFMDKMEERLAILVPDPKKLEKFEALKKAYDHYKLMEKLCQEETKED